MKLSFTINAKPKPLLLKKPAADDSPSINYITDLRPIEAADSKLKLKTIAPLANKKLKLISQFELDCASNPEAADDMYGLNLRQRNAPRPRPRPSTSTRILDIELRQDFPDAPELDDFEEVPVEGFGAALLAGYGWKEGRGIGRNSKEDVCVAQVSRKRDRGGLGFNSEPEPEKEKILELKTKDKRCIRKFKELRRVHRKI